MLAGVDRVLLRVASLEAAVTYYRDTLGMKLLRHEKRAAAFELGNAELVLHDSPDLPTQAVYFRVGDVKEIYAEREKLKLRFAGVPVTVTRGHSATVKDPFGNILLLLDRTKEASASGEIESAAPAMGTLFSGVEVRVTPKREALVAAYEAVGRTADDLPYTHHFESVFDAYKKAFDSTKPTRQETWRHLLNTRKAGQLPKLGEARSQAPETTDVERAAIRDLLGDEIGRRDRLPYTEKFDELVGLIQRAVGKSWSPHQIWRLVATLAK